VPLNHSEIIKVKASLNDRDEDGSLDFTVYVLPFKPAFASTEGGLLIRPSQNSPGEYKRVGVYFGDEDAELLSLIGDPTCCAKDSDYAEVSYDENGNARRIIVLI